MSEQCVPVTRSPTGLIRAGLYHGPPDIGRLADANLDVEAHLDDLLKGAPTAIKDYELSQALNVSKGMVLNRQPGSR